MSFIAPPFRRSLGRLIVARFARFEELMRARLVASLVIYTHSALIHCAESIVVFNLFSFVAKMRQENM